MNKKLNTINLKNNLPIIISILMLILSITLIISIIYINILPTKYLLIFILFLLIINIISTSIAVLKNIPTKIKTINLILNIIIIIFTITGSLFSLKTKTFLNKLNINYKTLNYSIIVLKNKNYKDLKSLEHLNIGYLNNNSEETNQSLRKINNIVKVNLFGYKDLNLLKESFINEKIDAVLLENSYYEILSDIDQEKTNETFEEFNNNFKNFTKIIYTFSINLETDKIAKTVDNIIINPFNVYISGLDTYGSISSVSRTDVNMIATINPTTHEILLTSIPRDYYVQLHGTKGLKDKLTHSGIYGIDMSVKTIEDLFNIDINYYFKVNFSSVINIIDKLDGVNVYSKYSFTSQDNYHYNKGYNFVNGKKALSFVRERKNIPGGDRQRIKNQQALLEAIIEKCLEPSIIIKYSSLLDSLSQSFTTNMTTSEIITLIKSQIEQNEKWTIINNSVDGKDSNKYTYSISKKLLSVIIPNENSVKKATILINSVLKGEDISKLINK